MKKIYPKEWLELHPYKKTDSVDQYYVGIANEIYEVLRLSVISEAFDTDENIRYASLCLAAWFEDVISQTGIWQTFTAECKKRYGVYLPFYPLSEEYFPDEINLEDVRFLLWHHIQYLCSERSIIHPENSGIEEVAQDVYDLLEDNYETAPENLRMQEYIQHSTMGEDDFMAYREVLEWFHYHCYINIENIDQYLDESEEILEDGQVTDEYRSNIIYGVHTTLMLRGRKSLLALTSPEWLALLSKKHATKNLWTDVKVLENSSYLLERVDDEYIYLKELYKEENELKVLKKSINLSRIRLQGAEKSILTCELVYFGNAWWQCGMMVENQLSKKVEDYATEMMMRKDKVNEKAAFRDFMKASGGKLFIFCKTQKEVEEFWTEKMGYDTREGVELPKMKINDGAILTAGPQTGLHVQTHFCECIRCDDNPFYDEEKAKVNAMMFILNPKAISYELSCILQDLNMLPDARLNSTKSQEYGQQFLHANAPFMTDYYFHRCREKDFCDKELLEYLNKYK